MKKYLLLFAVVMLQSLVFSQSPEMLPLRGTAEAFSKTSLNEMLEKEAADGPVEKDQLKKPNPVRYQPIFEVNQQDQLNLNFPEMGVQKNKEVSPLPDTTFNGLEDSGNSIPPDVNGAPGPDHLVVTLNTQVRIQDRIGNPLSTISLGGFWISLPGGGTFDPKILYDFEEDRWIFVTCAGSTAGDSRIYIGVTETSDPTGNWFLYAFIADAQNQVWFDYPSMGFNKKWIVVSGNMFGNANYRTVYVFDKQAMYQGESSPGFTRFATSQGFTLVPAITYDEEEENIYLISSANGNQGGSGYISLFKVSGETANPQFTYEGNIGTPNPWAGYVGGSGDFLPQLGSDQLINAVDHRIENVIMRNNKLWAVHHVFLPANNPQRTAVQWWNISPSGELLQHGRIDDPTGVMHYAFPTIAVNRFEDVLIGHNIFSANQYASSGYSYKAHFDPDGTLRHPYQYKDGLAPYYKTFGGGRNRWGDYSATMLDPVNSTDFWVLQEYAELPSGGDRWGTWWAQLRIPFMPEAEFSANYTLIPVGESIDFVDLTAGVPQNWEWTFAGAEPTSSNAQNPQNITFNSEGSFDVQLIVNNSFGADTIVKEGFIEVSSTLLPSVSFTQDKQLVCTGELVIFSDQSQYLPRSWEWEFSPSTVSFVNGTDAFSQNPQLVFNEPGDYSVTLTATNLNGSSSATVFNVVRAGGLDVPYEQQFNVQAFEEADWTVMNPDNQNTWELSPVEGLDGINQAAMIDFFRYYSIGERDRLISPPLDLRAYNQMQLSFKHAYAQRLPQLQDSLIVLITDDCGQSWTRLFANAENGSGNFATHPPIEDFAPATADDWCGAGYGAPCTLLDISNWAGKADVRIAFETYSFYGNPLFITDIAVGPTVGNAELEAQTAANIFPNPATETFTVLISDNQNLDALRLLDYKGSVILQHNKLTSGSSIDVSGLSKGMYIVEMILGEGKIIRQKLVLE